MTQLGEAIVVSLERDIDEECPFNTPDPPKVKVEPEHIAKDDLSTFSVVRQQKSSGGTLGKNLEAGSQGAPNTINDFCAADVSAGAPREDTRRTGVKVTVDVDGEQYPFTVAAHHLIPGNASLGKSRLFKKYMTKDGEVKTRSGKTYKIKEHIGYNVNGSHNGVWLPGNYAITRRTSPKKGMKWATLVASPGYEAWCIDYMLSCVKTSGGQFHDTHTVYNDKVLGILNKMHRSLVVHQDSCTECKSKTDRIAPPYMVKTKLYLLSGYLKMQLQSIPEMVWRIPWYTSDRFKQVLMRRGMLIGGP
jgi:hypothetical protein